MNLSQIINNKNNLEDLVTSNRTEWVANGIGVYEYCGAVGYDENATLEYYGGFRFCFPTSILPEPFMCEEAGGLVDMAQDIDYINEELAEMPLPNFLLDACTPDDEYLPRIPGSLRMTAEIRDGMVYVKSVLAEEAFVG